MHPGEGEPTGCSSLLTAVRWRRGGGRFAPQPVASRELVRLSHITPETRLMI